MGDFQRFACNLRAEAAGQSLVIIVSRIVIASRGQIDQAAKIAGNPGKCAVQEIFVGLLHGHESERGAHTFTQFHLPQTRCALLGRSRTVHFARSSSRFDLSQDTANAMRKSVDIQSDTV